MSEAPRGYTNDTSYETAGLFRDVAADLARRRDTVTRGETSPLQPNDAKVIDSYRWRDVALQSQRSLEELWDYFNRDMHRSTSFTGPACLASIHTKEQLREFLIGLLMPDLIDLIRIVINEERMQDGDAQLERGSEEAGSGEEEGATVADAGQTDVTGNEWQDKEEKEIPY